MARNFDLVERIVKCHGSLIWQRWAFIIIWYFIFNNCLSILPRGSTESYQIHSIQTDPSLAHSHDGKLRLGQVKHGHRSRSSLASLTYSPLDYSDWDEILTLRFYIDSNGVMVNYMYQWCPDIWSNIFLNVSVKVFLDEINI